MPFSSYSRPFSLLAMMPEFLIPPTPVVPQWSLVLNPIEGEGAEHDQTVALNIPWWRRLAPDGSSTRIRLTLLNGFRHPYFSQMGN